MFLQHRQQQGDSCPSQFSRQKCCVPSQMSQLWLVVYQLSTLMWSETADDSCMSLVLLSVPKLTLFSKVRCDESDISIYTLNILYKRITCNTKREAQARVAMRRRMEPRNHSLSDFDVDVVVSLLV